MNFFVQLTVNGIILEIGVHAVKIAVVDGRDDPEQLNRKQLMEESNVMDVPLKPEPATHTTVQVILARSL